jgi:hypothetical protein
MKLLLMLFMAVPALAQLPAIGEGPCLGFFAAHRDNRIEFGIASNGELRFMPAISGKPAGPFLSGRYTMTILPRVMDTRSDGKPSVRKVEIPSLESPDQPADRLEKTTIRGKVTGGAAFEIHVEQNRGSILLAGRLLEPGKLKNPQPFALQIKVPNLMTGGEKETLAKFNKAKEDDRKAQRERRDFMREFRDDRVMVRWSDGKQEVFKLGDGIDDRAKAINGPGIEELRLESERYGGRRIFFTAEPGSKLVLTPTRQGTLLAGFTLDWTPVPAGGEGKLSRLAISVR